MITIYLSVNFVWGIFVKEIHYKGGMNQSSKNIKQSKRKGCFVEKLSFEPNVIEINGFEFQINEVWIEKQHDLFFVVTLIPSILEYPIFINKKNFNINFNFIQDRIPDFFDDWFFVIEGKGNGFAQINGQYFTENIDTQEWKTMKIVLTNNWDFLNSKRFLIQKIFCGASENYVPN